MTTLQLWTARDGAAYLHWDEITWVSVWADGYETAVALARQCYQQETGMSDDETNLTVSPAKFGKDICWRPEPKHPWPHEEGRMEVLRQMGWRIEDELACDTCGLAAMGLDEFRVCGECYQCRECGCSCEEE